MKKNLSLIFFLLHLLIAVSGSAGLPDAYNEPLTTYAVKNEPAPVPENAVFVPPGVYSAGTDIPFGDYQLNTESYGCWIRYCYPEIDNAFNLYFGRNYGLTVISRIPMVEGSSIEIRNNGIFMTRIEFSPFSGGQFVLMPGFYLSGADIPCGSYWFSQYDPPYPATVYVKNCQWPHSSVFHGDIKAKTKVDLAENVYICIHDFPVAVSEYTSPFSPVK